MTAPPTSHCHSHPRALQRFSDLRVRLRALTKKPPPRARGLEQGASLRHELASELLPPLRPAQHIRELSFTLDAANGLPVSALGVCFKHCLVDFAEFHRRFLPSVCLG
jgi:hypothetical protein